MSFRLTVLIVLAVVAGCNGPVVLLPGGRLEGDVRPVPKSWSFAGDYGTAQLETRPQDPYSVNIAYTILDGAPFINAGDTETEWVKNIAADPRVKLRIDGVIYEMRAERVNSRSEIERFGKAWTSQSIFRRDPSQLDPVWIYRLVPRGSSRSA